MYAGSSTDFHPIATIRCTMRQIRVTRAVLRDLLQHARDNPLVECCGLLAGSNGVISELLPAINIRNSAAAYEIEPRELFELFRRLRSRKLDFLGIYHSHLRGANSPSPTDIGGAFYPEAAYFIITPQPENPQPVRAFQIRNNEVCELEIIAV